MPDTSADRHGVPGRAVTQSSLSHSGPLTDPRTWIASLLAVLIAAGAYLGCAAGSVAADAAPTCASGQTLFRSGPVRAFEITDASNDQEALVCPNPSTKPIVIDDGGPAVEVEAGDFHLRGVRLGFELEDIGLGAGGVDTELGWVDLQTGEVAIGLLDGGQETPENGPLPADLALVSYAFAPDGTTAMIAGAKCEVVAILPARAKPNADGYSLGPLSILFTARHGGLIHWSIAVNATTVTWRTVNGTKGSALRSGGSTGIASPNKGC
jgi:hypothetical protein